jgi:hypothetical protein
MLTEFIIAALTFGQTPKVHNTDDRDVLQTAMLSFLGERQYWWSSSWKPKNYIFIRTQTEVEKKSFEELVERVCYDFEEFITYAKGVSEAKLSKKELEFKRFYLESGQAFLKARSTSSQRTYTPQPLRPIKSMTWDKRIVVTDDSIRLRRRFDDKKPTDSRLEELGVYVSAYRPSYSPDGTMCIVKMSIPWSMHSADVVFLMERLSGNSWKINGVQTAFYV